MNPRCDYKDGGRRCPDSAGYRTRKAFPFGSGGKFLPGRFCLCHAGFARDRVPLNQISPEDR